MTLQVALQPGQVIRAISVYYFCWGCALAVQIGSECTSAWTSVRGAYQYPSIAFLDKLFNINNLLPVPQLGAFGRQRARHAVVANTMLDILFNINNLLPPPQLRVSGRQRARHAVMANNMLDRLFNINNLLPLPPLGVSGRLRAQHTDGAPLAC